MTATPSPSDPTRPGDPTTPRAHVDPAGLHTRPIAPAQLRDRGRYHILGEHGRGGLGCVTRAHDLELRRDVAIKELLFRDNIREARFVREAMITAHLEHPGIVPVHEAGRWPDGTPFYAMKLVSGRPLRDLIAERTSVDQRIGLLHHVIAVADAIAYAHGRNIIHRDLKPANIIVGDFGETVVIDWGLAKDLTAADDSLPGGASDSASPQHDRDLTAAGSVLGTPTYMAPEQERGEHVDQRADVFAIGAMLWELCALQKVPPTEKRYRHRLLRRAGIDKDLVTILDKALDPNPARRYPDAGALAADLKAFKSGARIAARDYSLFAMLAHWTRRHRALALSVTAAVALGTAGIARYIRDITTARDQADVARIDAEAHRQRAERDRAELVLQHSELLLRSDPTSAVAALADYHGDDDVRRRRLLAEARGRGTASSILSPHSDSIWFLLGEDSGAIISVSEDRTIRRTFSNQTITLADDVASNVLYDYAPDKRLLAYVTSSSGIKVLDLATLATTQFDTSAPRSLAIASDGSAVAAVDARGILTVWSVSSGALIWQESCPDANDIMFATPARIVVTERNKLRVIPLDGAPRRSRSITTHVRALDARADLLIVGDAAGTVTLLSPTLEEIARISACHKRVNAIRFIGHTDLATFACQDGIIGLLHFEVTRKLIIEMDTFTTAGAAFNASSDASGQWIIANSESNVVYLYDIARRLVHLYEGQGTRISHIAPPTPTFNNILVGDTNGTVRVWAPPPADAQVLIQAPRAIYDMRFDAQSTSLIMGGLDGIVRRVSISDGGVIKLHEHTGMVTRILASPEQGWTASRSSDGVLHVSRTSDGTMLNTFFEHDAEIGDVDYIEAGRRIVVASGDGRLVAWTIASGDQTVLFKGPRPLVALEVLHSSDHIVVADLSGAVWDVTAAGVVRLVRAATADTLVRLRASSDGRLVAVGTNRGIVTIYRTVDWTVLLTTAVGHGVRRIAFDPRGHNLVIASEDDHVQITSLDARSPLPWHSVPMAARDIAYAPDGETIAFVCSDGGAWFYSVHDDAWVYARDHFVETVVGVFSLDGRWFASGDLRGVVTIRDVAATISHIKPENIQ